jgi:spermidine synthase
VALNTFGGALASALFGVFLLPLVGSKWTLVLISLGYLSLAPEVGGWRWGLLVAPLALVFALPAILQIVQIPPGGKLVEYREGVMASVAVVEDANRQRVLRVDNRFQMGGTAASAAEYRQAHIPIMLHPAPKRALFLGVGTGISFGAASLYPGLQSDGVELVPEVLEVMPQFEPYNFAPGRLPQLKVFAADARRFVRTADASYDVIIADLFHPARDGAGSLYTVEHFRAIRERLAPRGLFCQWLPLHQLDDDMLRVIVRTFLEVFPGAQAWLLHFNVDIPVLGLIGSVEPIRHSRDWVETRLNSAPLEAQLKNLALADSVRLFGNLLAGPKELRAFAGDAPLNTDDQPRVTFGAPRFVYRKHAVPYGRLLELLKLGRPDFASVLGLGRSEEAVQFAQRLSKYATARDVYLGGLIAEGEGRRTQAVDLFVESAQLSEDFTLGYAQCLTYASLLAQTRPVEARALLQRLAEAQPSRPVAKEMLERLFPK